MSIKISVILPVYNAGDYIQETVQSVLNQTLPAHEIVLVDDGSTDNSLEICQQLANRFQHIQLHTQENAGPSVTRNRAVSYAKNDWVCFLDADDLFHPQRLELAAAFVDNETDAVICEFSRFTNNALPEMDTLHVENIQLLNPEQSQLAVLQFGYGLPRMMMRRNVYLDSGGLDENLVNNEDHELHFRMLTQRVKFKKTNAVLYYYRHHSGGSRLANNPKKIEYVYRALDKMKNQISMLPIELQDFAKQLIANRIASNALSQARIGNAEYKKHLAEAKRLSNNLKPYKKEWHNKLSATLGYGNLEELMGKFSR
ncbi:MAG: glycosyltransferase family A protein [Flavobacteriaceae bacterium]|nr:glycosyltransferase family A protein [Flavobacteriaceae bacterium]